MPPRLGAMATAFAVWVGAGLAAQAPAAPGARLDDDARVPALLAGLLKAHASWRLLDPERHPVGDYTRADLVGLRHWPPWAIGDFDRDGRPDVAAVIVADRSGGPHYGVVAVHASRPGRPQWIVPLASQPYVAAAVDEPADVVVAARCLECDTNTWYRWNGRGYEAQLYAMGETVVFGEATSPTTPQLFNRPVRRARPITTVEPCSSGRVRDVAGRPGHRWYLVDVTGATPKRGWVSAAHLTDPIDCAG